MATNCSSDPTAGCDNSSIVAAINSCCSSQSSILSEVSAKLTTINTTLTNCCEQIDTKNTRIIELLTIIANK